MKTVTLGEVADWGSGGTPKRSVSRYFGDGVPWLSIADLNDGIVDKAKESLTPEGIDNSSAKIVPAGTLLVAMYGSIGKLGITAREMCTSQAIAFAKPRADRIAIRYLYHYLLAHRPTLQALGRGGTQMNIGQGDLKKLRIALPALDDQRRIAAILDHADALRTKRRKVLAHLDSLTQSIFHDMFGEFRYWRWPTKRADELGNIQLGRQRSPKYQTGEWSRPYMRVANVQLNWLDLSDVLTMDFDRKDFETYRLKVGDILLNEGQNTELVGRPAMWRGEIPNCCFQNTLLRFQSDGRLIVPDFALHVFVELLRVGQFARISSKTSNVAHLGKSRFASMAIPTPPLSQQQDFAKRAAAVAVERAAVERTLAADEELFASLQSRAFRGEL